MKKARCPVCGEIQMKYDPSENNYRCSCGHVSDHHPDLCPTYHQRLGCMYSRSQRRSGNVDQMNADKETRR